MSRQRVALIEILLLLALQNPETLLLGLSGGSNTGLDVGARDVGGMGVGHGSIEAVGVNDFATALAIARALDRDEGDHGQEDNAGSDANANVHGVGRGVVAAAGVVVIAEGKGEEFRGVVVHVTGCCPKDPSYL